MSGTAKGRAQRVRKATAAFNQSVNASGGIRLRFNDDDGADTRGMDRVFVGLGATLDAIPDVLREDAVPAIRAAFSANFDREGGRSPWAQLAPRTRLERARLGYGPAHPILERTGALRRHVVDAPVQVRRVGDVVELRVRPGDVVRGVPKYRALALGSSARNLPGRPMVVLNQAGARAVTSAVSRGLRRRAYAAGLG